MNEDALAKSLLEKLGVHLLRIKLPFRLDHVNCFMAEGEEGWTVIDTGLHNQETAKAWNHYLEGKKVTDIMITHFHQDHYGYAGTMQQNTGAKVSSTQKTVDFRILYEEAWFNKLNDYYVFCGIPKGKIDQMIYYIRNSVKRVTPHPVIEQIIEENDRIFLGEYEYEVILVNGHAEGMICLFNHQEGVLFSADHVLPGITPNVSYRFFGDQNPLNSFHHSLKRVRDLHAEWVIPSHGKPFYNCNQRIDELLIHHEERLAETLEIIKNKSTPYEVALKLFKRDLSIHELRAGMGETLAHLEYLYHQGDCKKEIHNRLWTYSI